MFAGEDILKLTVIGWILIFIMVNLSIAGEFQYYAEVSAVNAGAKVSLNGFPLFSNSGETRSTSSWVSPYLVNGKNLLHLTYLPTAQSNENSYVESTVSSVPHGIKRVDTKDNVLVNIKVGSRKIWIQELKEDEIEIVAGSRDRQNGSMIFESKDQSVQWRCVLGPELGFSRIPSRVDYSGLNHEMRNVRFHFIDHNKPERHVVFNIMTMNSGRGSIDLDQDKIISGADHHKKNQFNELFIEGESKGRGATKIYSLLFREILGNVEKTHEFDVDLGHRWSWEKADDISGMTKDDETGLWKAVVKIHDAFDKGNLGEIGNLFKFKVKDYSMALFKQEDELESDQLNFYGNFMKDQNWGLVPISRKDFKYSIVNTKVVKVERQDGREIINSKPLNAHQGKSRTFEVPIYLSRINGTWKVVR